MTKMCDGCSIQKNRDEWAKYPDMLDLCKLCQSFQKSIEHTIEEAQKMLDKTAQMSKKLDPNKS
jgi:hypothetical protein